MSKMFDFDQRTFMLSSFTPDVVSSGFEASCDMSFGGIISIEAGCARAPRLDLQNPNLGGLIILSLVGFLFFQGVYLFDLRLP